MGPANSGPGGRRFKSSLPDHHFQQLKIHVIDRDEAAVGESVTARAFYFSSASFRGMRGALLGWAEEVAAFNRLQTISAMNLRYTLI